MHLSLTECFQLYCITRTTSYVAQIQCAIVFKKFVYNIEINVIHFISIETRFSYDLKNKMYKYVEKFGNEIFLVDNWIPLCPYMVGTDSRIYLVCFTNSNSRYPIFVITVTFYKVLWKMHIKLEHIFKMFLILYLVYNWNGFCLLMFNRLLE